MDIVQSLLKPTQTTKCNIVITSNTTSPSACSIAYDNNSQLKTKLVVVTNPSTTEQEFAFLFDTF